MKYIIQSFTSLAIIIFLSSFNTTTDYNLSSKWERLGSRTVDFKLDRDIIHIGAKEGRFSKLKLAVSGADLSMHKMQIEYYSGQLEIVNLKHKFNKRSSSRTVDIDGRKRKIKNITLWYNTKKRSKRKAKITVLGR